MDVHDLTGTETAYVNIKTEPHMEENTSYLDVMEIIQLSIAPVGIIGNLSVIVVFLSKKNLRCKIPNRFIVNQSILDLIVSIVFMFIALFNKPNDVMDRSGIIGFLECMFWEAGFFFWTLSVASTYNIVTMTVERHNIERFFLSGNVHQHYCPVSARACQLLSFIPKDRPLFPTLHHDPDGSVSIRNEIIETNHPEGGSSDSDICDSCKEF